MISLVLQISIASAGVLAVGLPYDNADAPLLVAQSALEQTRECSTGVQYKRRPASQTQLNYYMRTQADSELQCAQLLVVGGMWEIRCFERVALCRAALYRPSTGECMFSYTQRPQHCSSLADNAIDEDDAVALVCVRCQYSVQMSSSDKPFGALKEKEPEKEPVPDLSKVAKDAVPYSQSLSVSRRQRTTLELQAEPGIRDNPLFKQLMPQCGGRLRLSTYPIFEVTSFVAYTQYPARSYVDCAHTCWSQHFCVSALYHNNVCVLSPFRGVCTDGYVSPLYRGPVLISCLGCEF